MRRILTLVSAVALVGTAVLAAAPAGQAAGRYSIVSTCPGSMVSGFPKTLHNAVDETQGTVELRYSSANGGTNCAKVYDNASGKHAMSVTMTVDGIPGSGQDSGTFETYAGGVLVTGTNGHCAHVSGTLVMGTHSIDHFSFSSGPVACG
ncbi:hypothetical protein ABZU76_24810 [Amycolatopsis sp. NPDC005232]|uniref:hypothetical protein n=1 Tax=Amycolatopsis sp. NPDC005232 TaxID=3157027 RepID=UPI0033A24664